MEDMDIAIKRLAMVNVRLSGIEDREGFEETDFRIRTCKALCRFFKTDIKLPDRETQNKISNLTEELIYLSNLRCKEVVLPEKWWKKDSGAMLGSTVDGTPIALLPNRMGGYTYYDPRNNQSSRLKKKDADLIGNHALAIFRPFPTGGIKANGILSFLAGENIGKEIITMFFFSFFAGIVAVVPPMVSAYIFDAIVPNTLRGILFEIVILLFCFDIANICFRTVSNVSISRMITKLSIALEGGIWDRLLGMRLPFFSRYTSGELLKKLQGIARIKTLVSVETIQNLLAAFFSFVNIVVLVRLDAEITAYALLMFLGLFVAYAAIEYQNFKYHQRYIDNENKATAFNQQVLNAIQRVKASRTEERVYQIWSGFESEKRYLLGRIKIFENLNSVIQLFFGIASAAVIFFLAARKADTGIGVFIAFVAAFLLLQNDMLRLLKVLNILPELAALYHNASPILQGEGEYNSRKIIPRDMTGSIEINHLSFRYGDYGKLILQNVSFQVEEGESLGLIGPSGCGKSTLLRTLLGFYPLAGGKIYYGGYDLETIELRHLRKQMGVVLQNGIIPVGTIFDILTDNDPYFSVDTVLSALDMVEMATEIQSLPQGLYTRIEDCNFSDSQCQRIMIARALTKDHRFIFFDEPTSRLDNISQQRILEHIYQTKSTKIIVAQRLSTVKGCNRIMILGKGTIIEQGTYEDIMGSDDIQKWLS